MLSTLQVLQFSIIVKTFICFVFYNDFLRPANFSTKFHLLIFGNDRHLEP